MSRARFDPNLKPTLIAIDMDDADAIVPLEADPATGRLLVSAIITGGSSSGTECTEGDTDASFTGTIMLGEKPGNTAFPLQINSSGELIVAATATLAKDTLPVSGATEAVSVAILDSSGNQISSFGGGTQYTEGDTDATITGTALMVEGGGNALVPAQGTVADGILVNLGSNNDVTVAGVSTAANQTTIIGHLDGVEGLLTTIDADTGNIATSTAAIDANAGATTDAAATAGGTGTISAKLRNLTDTNNAIKTAVEIIDDWDESDRAKVNLIVGQAGITAGAGAVAANTPRMTLASDDPAVASLSVLDDWDESDRAKVNLISGQAGVTGGVGATGANTLRMVEANDAGRTLQFKYGTVSSSGDNTLVAAGTNKLKVYAFSLSTTSTMANTVKFQSSTTDLWGYTLQAPSSISVGANLAVTPPAYLFATASATALELNLSAAVTVHYSVAYFDEA